MADGSVTFITEIDKSGVDAGVKDISDSLHRIVSLLEEMVKSINGTFTQFASGADIAAKSTENLREEIEKTVKAQDEWKPQDMSDLKISRGEEYAVADNEGEVTDEERQALHERTKEILKAANEEADAFNGEKEKVNELYEAIRNAKEEVKTLEKSGKWWGDDEYDEAAIKLSELNKQAQEYKKTVLSPAPEQNPFGLDTLAGKLREAKLELKQLEESGKSLGDTDYDKAYQKVVALTAESKEYKKNLAVAAVLGENNQELNEQNKKLSIAQGLADKIRSTFAGISKNLSSGAIKSSGKSMADGFGNALKTLLKYSFGIRSLFVLVNRFRSAMVEGFKNLAQYSDGTNASISMLLSALTQLKNALATAFSPILTVAAPILTTLINLLTQATTYIGMFFAALTGQKTFTKAIAVQEDYAKSLQKTSSNTKQAAKDTKAAAKETEGYLSSLDEIERYSSNKNSDFGSSPVSNGGYTAPTPSEMFETVPVENQFKELADKVKKVFSEIFTPFKEAWKKEGEKTIKAAKYALDSLGKLAKSVGKSLLEVWTNGTGTQMFTTMLQIGQNVLTTVGNIASGLADAWNTNNVGTTIIQNIADALQIVLDFINKIAADTATWAANLDFYPLLESISNLTATFAPILEAIGNVLEGIYNNIVLPMLTWAIETGLPTVINLVSDLLGFFADHQSIVEAFGAALIGAFAAVKIAALAKSIGGSITTVMGFGKGLIALMTGSSGILGGIKAIATAIGAGGVFAIAIGAAIAIGVLLYKNWDTIKEVAGKAWNFVIDKTKAMAEAAGRKLTELREKVSGIWNAVKEKTESIWKAVTTFVGGKVAAIRDAIVNKFSSARDRVVEIFGGIRDTIRDILNKVIGIVNGAIGTVNSAIGGIESAFSFGPWEVPTPFGKKVIGFNASFPRVPTIPYLAKGAVIPPRSEFLAVLGDQKNGRNLEAPEGVIREIMEDVLAKYQGGGGDTRLTVLLNRRVLFDEFIKEARTRRDSSGVNPFELA